jgi:hypothetical protein
MSSFVIKKAKRDQIKLVMLLQGVSGVGKTYTALQLFSHMINQAGPTPDMQDEMERRICVIDTDNGRSQRYADGKPFYFSVLELKDARGAPNHSPEAYMEAYQYALSQGFDHILIDSVSDEWEFVINDADRQAKAGERNKERIWGNLTPRHNAFLRTITSGRAHTIATCLMKPAYETIDGPNGKKSKQRVGDAPIQRVGVERLFDIASVIEEGCTMRFVKTLCSKLAGTCVDFPGRELALTLNGWLAEGEPHRPSTLDEIVDHLAPKLAVLTGTKEEITAGAVPVFAELRAWCTTRNMNDADMEAARLRLRAAGGTLMKNQNRGADQGDTGPTSPRVGTNNAAGQEA